MRRFPVIERQLNAYATDVEPWLAAHREAMNCCEVQDEVEFGLFILGAIRDRERRWGDDVRGGACEFDWEDSRGFARLCGARLERSREVVRLIERCETDGYAIDGSAEFREQVRVVALLPSDVDSVRQSIASLEEGRGTPLRQALDGLRDRLR